MTKEWKAGDRAMVRIERMNGRDATLVGNGGYSIDVGSLRPLPPAMTDAEKALVEAVLTSYKQGLPLNESTATMFACEAVLAERAPPDPVEVAWALWAGGEGLPVPQDFRSALKAYDAAKGEKS